MLEEDGTGWGHVVDIVANIRRTMETMASIRRHWEIVLIIRSHGGERGGHQGSRGERGGHQGARGERGGHMGACGGHRDVHQEARVGPLEPRRVPAYLWRHNLYK